MEQFLTAVFELRPTRRKAAALERVRAAAETAFWATLAAVQPAAEAAVSQSRQDRQQALRHLGVAAIAAATRLG